MYERYERYDINIQPAYDRLPLATIGMRNGALAIDFAASAFTGQLIEALLGIDPVSGGGLLVFGLAWLLLRVVLAGANQGQSLGRWAMSLKTVDALYGKPAGMLELLKREGLVMVLIALFLAALRSPTTAALFAIFPLVIDGAVAYADDRKRQTLHDKLGGTIVILSRSGFQLDRKLSAAFNGLVQLTRRPERNAYDTRRRDGFDRGYHTGRSEEFYGEAYREPWPRQRPSRRPRRDPYTYADDLDDVPYNEPTRSEAWDDWDEPPSPRARR